VGAWTRRSAIAWMMGSWGARLTVQSLYTRSAEHAALTSPFRLPPSALFFSLPALIACRNPEPSLSPLEIGAAALWMIAFALETTADRQFLRFTTKAEQAEADAEPVGPSGLWRVTPRAHEACELLIWTGLALFALASPWGWIAAACPAVLVYAQSRRRITQ
jgi:uncharacterized protein DUF1295